MDNLTGRENELLILEKLWNSPKAEFLAIYGRRRIGKTYLISQFFKKKGLYFEITGTKNAPKSEQLRHFAQEFSACFLQGKRFDPPANWSEAFFELKNQIERLDPQQKVILFFDELPWLSSRKSGFLEALDHVWNRYLSRLNNVILIVCGSAASWMIQKVISDKGGLYGRLTAQIRLLPFTLLETERFLKAHDIVFERKQLVELYMALGGVATYLGYVERGKSVPQIIQELCFSSNGALHSEFNQLYDSLFDHADQHIQIVQALATKWSGLTTNELLQATGLPSGGSFTHVLRELQESGFITYVPDFKKKKRDGKFRLMDEFSLFYLRFMEEAASVKSLQRDYWMRAQSTPQYTTWAGYAFEGICLKHLRQIIQALKLDVVASHSSGWFSKKAQIDLLIDRSDACINLCEIKFYRDIWDMSESDSVLINRRREYFREATKTKKSLFNTLVTPYGAKPNQNYLSSVDQQLTLEHLFASP